MLKSKTIQGHKSKLARQKEYDATHPISVKFDALRQKFGGRCVVCGFIAPLEFAHIKPTKLSGDGRGQRARYYDIVNNPDAYVLMTTNCHKDFDQISPELKEEWLSNNAKFK
jgi:hypothetical protein